ncbi:hypothetical protein BpHYR1_052414 [Brachionus plicatilis]|uniref:Uncharacterized protein n=1 Tax=Brachionus plicatilis TaxID=10195 RepID=A0A3M7Q452_BRAPC|nr:hypothetical protein BpHYR1_052414 [Brachionus plicatilis]
MLSSKELNQWTGKMTIKKKNFGLYKTSFRFTKLDLYLMDNYLEQVLSNKDQEIFKHMFEYPKTFFFCYCKKLAVKSYKEDYYDRDF